MLGAEEGECVGGAAGVDRIGIRCLPVAHDVLAHFFGGGEEPPLAFIVRRQHVVPGVEPGLRLLDRVVEYLLCFRVWIEGLAPLDADGLERGRSSPCPVPATARPAPSG